MILNLKKGIEYFHGDPKTGNMAPAAVPDSVDQELEKDTIGLFQTADDLYMSRKYRVDGN